MKQRLLRIEGLFDERRLGFETFRDFLGALNGCTVDHDGTDIVVSFAPESELPSAAIETSVTRPRGAGQPPQLVDHEHSTPRVGRLRVHPHLWQAFIRPSGSSPAFLDLPQARAGEVRIVIPTSPQELSRLRGMSEQFVEIPSTAGQMSRWLSEWSKAMLSESDAQVVAEVLEGEQGLRRAQARLYDLKIDRAWARHRTRKSFDLLRAWATENGLRWAHPLLVGSKGTPLRVEAPRVSTDVATGATMDIRSLAHAVVDRLPDEDLRRIVVPLGTVFDALQG